MKPDLSMIGATCAFLAFCVFLCICDYQLDQEEARERIDRQQRIATERQAHKEKEAARRLRKARDFQIRRQAFFSGSDPAPQTMLEALLDSCPSRLTTAELQTKAGTSEESTKLKLKLLRELSLIESLDSTLNFLDQHALTSDGANYLVVRGAAFRTSSGPFDNPCLGITPTPPPQHLPAELPSTQIVASSSLPTDH